MNIDQKKSYSIIEKEQFDWSNLARKTFQSCWRKTLIDDKTGIISLLSHRIIDDLKVVPKHVIKRRLKFLGAASLLFWTAANLQDDLSDEKTTPKEYIPLANICLRRAHLFCYQFSLNHPETNEQFKNILHAVDEANLRELSLPNAGKYFLSAKQLADDVYDYQDDWKKGRRNFAHRNLTKLPNRKELPIYFHKQALRIKALCLKSRKLLKAVSALKNGNCFDEYLLPIETNCDRVLANLKLQAQANYNHSKKTQRFAPQVTTAPARNL